MSNYENVSVAMATYNGERYLAEQLDSILCQTVRNIEVVVCDDCSTDGTWDILQDYAARDSRVIAFRNEHNIGSKKTFDQAVSRCRGELICLSDQDDVWFPDHIEMLMEHLTDGVQIVCGRPLFVDEKLNTLPKEYDYFRMRHIPQSDMDAARHILLCMNTYQGASMLVRRSFFKYANPIPEQVLYHDAWYAALACFTGGITYVDKHDLYYRRLSTSLTGGFMARSPLRDFICHIVYSRMLFDRLHFVTAIRERVNPMLTDEQKAILTQMEKMLRRRNTLWGRIRNIPYMIRHFRSIYCC